jgi:F-type H+-transporting ATPase subunit delta
MTARSSSAARRYAEAAFEVARDEDALERWASDLRAAAAVTEQEDVANMLGNPGIPFDRRRQALEAALTGVDEKVRNLVLLLLQRGRAEAVGRVAERFQSLVDRHNGVLAGRATSAAPLSPEEADAMRARMQELTGARVELIFDVDPALLGGVVVRIGDRMWDGSVRGRLERLRSRLIAQTI